MDPLYHLGLPMQYLEQHPSVVIVLDTSVLVPDFKIASNRVNILKALLPSLDGFAFVPDVVRDELLANYRSDSERALRALRPLENLLKKSLIDATKEDIIRELGLSVSTALHQHRFGRLPYPKVDHHRVVERMYSGRKPFHSAPPGNEKGYRDYLVWCSILELASDVDSQIIFISENVKQFASEKDRTQLHSDLITDLESIGVGLDKVRFFGSLGEYIAVASDSLDSAVEEILRQEPTIVERLERELPPLVTEFEQQSVDRSPESWIDEGEPGRRIFDIGEVDFEVYQATKVSEGFIVVGTALYSPAWHYGDPGDLAVDNELDVWVELLLNSSLEIQNVDVGEEYPTPASEET